VLSLYVFFWNSSTSSFISKGSEVTSKVTELVIT
jgi:hypothetical protein